MATNTPDDASIKMMEEHLTCNICFNLLKEPKDLDCPHVFCLQCLQQWVKTASKVKCPECRQITIVPHGGLANLRSNLRLKNMAEDYVKTIGKQKGIPICSNHEGERQHFFCVTCDVTVCRDCLVLEHERPLHDIKELKAFAEMCRAKVKVQMNRVEEEIKKSESKEVELDEAQREGEFAKQQAVRDVTKHACHIIATVEAKEKEMIDRIEATYQEHTKILNEKQKCIKEKVTQLRSIQTSMDSAVDIAEDHMYMKQHTSLIDKMEQLCISECGTSSEGVRSLRFSPGSDQVISSGFGDAMIYDSTICGLQLEKEFGAFEQAISVAVSQTGLLAVVDNQAKEVAVYRKVSGEYQRMFCLDSSTECPDGNMTRPFNVALTSGGRLFVTHSGYLAKVFSPAGRYEKTLHDVGGRITTTPDDMIVTGSSATGVITVHQSDGELIRRHQVDCDYMADIASNGKQIVLTTASKGYSIHAIDFVTGQTIWTVNNVLAIGICYEPKTNTLLVAGGSKTCGQYIIQQYCSSTGRLMSRLASSLYNPFSMTVTCDGKLIVADWKTLKVYAIQ